jgi:ATP-binding cassette, subfamily B, heavy metal transporter
MLARIEIRASRAGEEKRVRRGERTKTEPAAPPEAPIVPALRRLLALVGGLKGGSLRARLWVALVITVIAKGLTVYAPLVLADGINAISTGSLSSQVFDSFLFFVIVWTLLRFAGTAGPQARDALFAPVSEEAQRRAGVAVFRHVHSLSISFHQTKRTGGLFRTIERGVRSIDFLLRFLGFNIIPTAFELALAAILLAWKFGIAFSAIAVATVVVYAWLTLSITEWRLAHRREMNDLDTEASSRAVDSLLNFETVKAFASSEREVATYDHALSSYAKAAVRSNTSLVILNVVQSAVMGLGLAAMVAAAGWMVTGGALGPGGVTAVMLIMLNLYTPLNVLGFAYREIKQASIDMEKMFALLDERPDVDDAPSAPLLAVSMGRVVFENVAFAHDGRSAGLRNVSFVIEPGTTTALVGPSGAGKSTALKLLMRFYDPDEGRITIDGQDIRGVSQGSLRHSLGLVPQDVVLFNDTIEGNIGYARPEASKQEREAAAERAQLLSFIEDLPEGWATRVGERGLKLSGGEKQRVGVARVLLLNPPILILDEATSALDSRTEAGMQGALKAAMDGRTSLVVAHRLSTIAGADQIIVLDQGEIVERGRHEELIERNGLYADLWRRQARTGESSNSATFEDALEGNMV